MKCYASFFINYKNNVLSNNFIWKKDSMYYNFFNIANTRKGLKNNLRVKNCNKIGKFRMLSPFQYFLLLTIHRRLNKYSF